MKEPWQVPICVCNLNIERQIVLLPNGKNVPETRYGSIKRVVGKTNLKAYKRSNGTLMPYCKKCDHYRYLIADPVIQALVLAKYGKQR